MFYVLISMLKLYILKKNISFKFATLVICILGFNFTRKYIMFEQIIVCIYFCTYFMHFLYFADSMISYSKYTYSPFHKTLPRSSYKMHLISVRFYEMGDISGMSINIIKVIRNFLRHKTYELCLS